MNHINNNGNYIGLSDNERLIEKCVDGTITEEEFNNLIQESSNDSDLAENLALRIALEKKSLARMKEKHQKQVEEMLNIDLDQFEMDGNLEVEISLDDNKVMSRIDDFLAKEKETKQEPSFLQENILNPINKLVAIFQQHYETLPFIEVAYRSRRGLLEAAEKHGNIVITMRESYKNGDFQEFIEEYNETANEKVKADLQLQYAIALFEVGRVEEAEQQFIFMIRKDHYDTEKINWLLSMLYLQQGKVDSAKKYLQEVIDCPIPYRVDDAKEILSNL